MMENAQNNLKIWEGTVLTVPNCHYEVCGKPPDLKAGRCYTAYFENHYGEQIVFQFDYKERKGTLWHGDCGWDESYKVMAGGTTVILSDEEREWLRLVWRVATSGESREFQLRSALELVDAQKAIYDELLARPEFAGDSFMKRQFAKTRKGLEKEEKSIVKDLETLQGVEKAERIIQDEEGEP